MEGIPVYVLHPRPVRSFPYIHKACDIYDIPSMATYPFSAGPTSWGVCGLDGGHPCIWTAVQACQIIFVYARDMLKGWQPIHGQCTSYHIPHLSKDILVLYRSWKILAHSFGGQWHVWRSSTHIFYIPGLWDLSPMYSQGMWNIWQPIHGHLYLTSYPTHPCGSLGGL